MSYHSCLLSLPVHKNRHFSTLPFCENSLLLFLLRKTLSQSISDLSLGLLLQNPAAFGHLETLQLKLSLTQITFYSQFFNNTFVLPIINIETAKLSGDTPQCNDIELLAKFCKSCLYNLCKPTVSFRFHCHHYHWGIHGFLKYG